MQDSKCISGMHSNLLFCSKNYEYISRLADEGQHPFVFSLRNGTECTILQPCWSGLCSHVFVLQFNNVFNRRDSTGERKRRAEERPIIPINAIRILCAIGTQFAGIVEQQQG